MVVILMIITSMGIFGFLSKGHIEQEAPTIEFTIDIKEIESKISQHNNKIQTLEKQLKLINDSLQTLIDFKKISGPAGYLEKQKELQPQILELQKGIEIEKTYIRDLISSKSKIEREIGTIEAKLGPIKYVAELFGYDLTKDKDGRGKAVRIIIIMFMIAFDPFAIFLVMASNWTFMRYHEEQKDKKVYSNEVQEYIDREEIICNDIDKCFKEIVETYKKIVNTKDEEITFLNQELQNNDVVERVVFRDIEVPVEVENTEKIKELQRKLEEKTVELNEYIQILNEIDKSMENTPKEIDKIISEHTEEIKQLTDQVKKYQDEIQSLNTEKELLIKDIKSRDQAVQKLNEKYNLIEKIPSLGIKADNVSTFGVDFPKNPKKGQLFLRVDIQPNQLFTYEGTRWIEKTSENYVQELIRGLETGDILIDSLSPEDRESIYKVLKKEDIFGK